MTNPTDTLSGDLVWGVGAIATEIGVTKRQAFYLIGKKSIPVRKVGARKYVASRKALRAYLAEAGDAA